MHNSNSRSRFEARKIYPRPARPPRRKRIPPVPAIPCRVLLLGSPLYYNKTLKTLMGGEEVTSFPSHKKARIAIWHTIQYYNEQGLAHKDGTPYFDTEFEIRDIKP